MTFYVKSYLLLPPEAPKTAAEAAAEAAPKSKPELAAPVDAEPLGGSRLLLAWPLELS